jgi:hypothetical protein
MSNTLLLLEEEILASKGQRMSTRFAKGDNDSDEDNNGNSDEDENQSRLERQEMLEEPAAQGIVSRRRRGLTGQIIEKEVLRRRRERGRWAKKYGCCYRATSGNGRRPFLAASQK